MSETNSKLKISSPAFTEGGDIPMEYTCQGQDVNPPLTIEGLPPETVTLALIMEDPDAPVGTFDHWIVWNIERSASIPRASNPGISGINSARRTGYLGPCPPSGSHRYYFLVYALDAHLNLAAGADKATLRQAMESHILAEGSLMGRYQKQ